MSRGDFLWENYMTAGAAAALLRL